VSSAKEVPEDRSARSAYQAATPSVRKEPDREEKAGAPVQLSLVAQ